MSHENILFHFRAGEPQAFLVGFVEVIEVDGKFLPRRLSGAYYHLGGEPQFVVSDARCRLQFLQVGQPVAHFLHRHLGSWFPDGWFPSSVCFFHESCLLLYLS